MIERGRADAMLAGGSDSALTRLTYHSQAQYGMLRTVEDPARASMPFDAHRPGIVEGEGSAMVLLERADAARARGAFIYGYVRGYAAVAEAYHPSSPQPDGTFEERAMSEALADAGIAPDDVDAILAHGTGTPVGDTAEIRAINRLFARQDREAVAVTSVKGHVGHSGGAANATALLAGLYSLEQQALVPTAGTTELDPEVRFRVPLRGQPLPLRLDTFVVNGFGFGGQDSCLVISRSA